MTKFVFIVGVGRSGTSLLQSMLAANPEIVAPPETGLLRRYVIGGHLDKLVASVGLQRARIDLLADPRVQRLGEEALAEISRWPDGAGDRAIELYRRLMRRWGQGNFHVLMVDKDPRLVEHLRWLNEWFPDAHAIHVVREPRDVLASKKLARWSRRRPSLLHILAGLLQLRLGLEEGPAVFGDRYREVRYESLLTDPRSVLSDLCQWLKVTYTDAMLEFQSSARQLVASDEVAWKKETIGPLLSDNVGKWRNVLVPFEAACAAAAFAPYLQQFDYRLKDKDDTDMAPSALVASACAVLLRLVVSLALTLRRFSQRRQASRP